MKLNIYILYKIYTIMRWSENDESWFKIVLYWGVLNTIYKYFPPASTPIGVKNGILTWQKPCNYSAKRKKKRFFFKGFVIY